MKMTELQKYWYVSDKLFHVIENGMSSTLSYADIVEGKETDEGLLIFSVNGSLVYGEVILPLEFFKEVDFNAAYLKEQEL